MILHMIKEITIEDIELVRSNIILQIVLQIIEQDSKQIVNDASAALKQFYITMFEQLDKSAYTVLSGIRREMHKRGIRIESTKRTTRDLTANYLVRGSAGKIVLDWGTIKEEASKRMKAYMVAIMK